MYTQQKGQQKINYQNYKVENLMTNNLMIKIKFNVANRSNTI